MTRPPHQQQPYARIPQRQQLGLAPHRPALSAAPRPAEGDILLLAPQKFLLPLIGCPDIDLHSLPLFSSKNRTLHDTPSPTSPQREALSFRASDRCHWRGNPFPAPADAEPHSAGDGVLQWSAAEQMPLGCDVPFVGADDSVRPRPPTCSIPLRRPAPPAPSPPLPAPPPAASFPALSASAIPPPSPSAP